MMRSPALMLVVVVACRPPAPGSAPAAAADAAPIPPPAGVRFVQGMIPHHAQALEMTRLVPARTTRPAIRLLAERIEVSQTDEIRQMRHWLDRRGRGADAPEPDAYLHAAMGHGELMPGMLTQDELTQLANARGPDFDRLFLRLMIRHHEGALSMVADLFGAPGAHDAQLFTLASDVDADQRAEIKRMHSLQESLP